MRSRVKVRVGARVESSSAVSRSRSSEHSPHLTPLLSGSPLHRHNLHRHLAPSSPGALLDDCARDLTQALFPTLTLTLNLTLTRSGALLDNFVRDVGMKRGHASKFKSFLCDAPSEQSSQTSETMPSPRLSLVSQDATSLQSSPTTLTGGLPMASLPLPPSSTEPAPLPTSPLTQSNDTQAAPTANTLDAQSQGPPPRPSPPRASLYTPPPHIRRSPEVRQLKWLQREMYTRGLKDAGDEFMMWDAADKLSPSKPYAGLGSGRALPLPRWMRPKSRRPSQDRLSQEVTVGDGGNRRPSEAARAGEAVRAGEEPGAFSPPLPRHHELPRKLSSILRMMTSTPYMRTKSISPAHDKKAQDAALHRARSMEV